MAKLNTLFTARQMEWLESVDSTNRHMNRKTDADLSDGFVVASLYQSAGRGQGEKYWHSEPGKNLLMSVYWKPDFIEAANVVELSKAVAAGIQDMLKENHIETWMRYPNDIYAGNKKIAGILIENTLRGSKVQHSVIGIGLNVNQTEFPADLPNPVSMKNLTGDDYDLKDCLNVLCNHLEKNYLQLKNK
jgi:BirA family biotin operon repressor/biotin-[acetyl-CoA-carboxylase] ligase